MSFQTQSGWCCQFLEKDLKTVIPVRLNLLRQERLFEIAERGGFRLNLEGRQAIQRAIDMGRGGIWLELSDEQYQRLKGNIGLEFMNDSDSDPVIPKSYRAMPKGYWTPGETPS